ncbi:MAG: hypothetical protein IKB59_01590 [Alphaproteobacteria bacterium]|nr:hypothetical protein [Alphaproteobacteria bacterium]
MSNNNYAIKEQYVISGKDIQYLQDKVSNMETIVSHCEVCSKVMPDINRMKMVLDKIQSQKEH